jgi:predicted metalloprotease with PDZ domain
MKYSVFYQNPHQRLINIEFFTNVNKNKTILRLPSWRPGRYELGNFAKNIVKFEVLNNKGQSLPFNKLSKDSWEVLTANETVIRVKYNVFTPDFNAGACWIDSKQLYINGIHCFLYDEDKINEPCELNLSIPKEFKTVIGLKQTGSNHFIAKDYHELVDSPFVSSPTLIKHTITEQNILFNLWFQGVSEVPFEQLEKDFRPFIKEQLSLFKEFVAGEYHFIFQITPYKHYHGVEHTTSTVITLGPAKDVFNKPLYHELLGISSHELFHCWNIKSIRPAEMLPYRYHQENYTKLGYVAEGVTTYYGDYILFRSKVFNQDEFFKCMNNWLEKHFENFGRFNKSVADSSFDTWLDGYVAGVPNRKTSIYNEGALCAFILDVLIRKHTNNSHSLDDVMLKLFYDFGKKEIGYTAQNFREIAEEVAGTSLCSYFDDIVNGTKDYEPYLTDCFNYLGLQLNKENCTHLYESLYGFKTINDGNHIKIRLVYPDSIADRAGLMVGSSLIKINNLEVNKETIEKAIEELGKNEILLELDNFGHSAFLKIKSSSKQFFKKYSIQLKENTDNKTKSNYALWSNNRLND